MVCLTKVYLKFQFKYSLSSPSNLLNFFLAVRGFSIYQTPEVETLFIYVLLYLILDSECLLDYSPTSASIITSLAMSSIPGLLQQRHPQGVPVTTFSPPQIFFHKSDNYLSMVITVVHLLSPKAFTSLSFSFKIKSKFLSIVFKVPKKRKSFYVSELGCHFLLTHSEYSTQNRLISSPGSCHGPSHFWNFALFLQLPLFICYFSKD